MKLAEFFYGKDYSLPLSTLDGKRIHKPQKGLNIIGNLLGSEIVIIISDPVIHLFFVRIFEIITAFCYIMNKKTQNYLEVMK